MRCEVDVCVARSERAAMVVCRALALLRIVISSELDRLIANSESTWRWTIDSAGQFVLPSNVTEVVIEVGANDLVDFHEWLDADPRRMAFSFEPLVKATKARRHPRQVVVHAAVAPARAGETSTLFMHTGPGGSQSSLKQCPL